MGLYHYGCERAGDNDSEQFFTSRLFGTRIAPGNKALDIEDTARMPAGVTNDWLARSLLAGQS